MITLLTGTNLENPNKDTESEPSRPRFRLNTIPIQPTTLCNLGCDYCYLSEDDLRSRNMMDAAIPAKLAQELELYHSSEPESDWCVTVVWHGGEPLTVKPERLREDFCQPFDSLIKAGRVRLEVQTNATRITPELCQLFKEYNVGVGVSIDGPRWANGKRVTLSGAEAFQRTMEGIDCLRAHNVPFDVTAVVSHDSIPLILERIDEYLNFFSSIGAIKVGFNIEEQEGKHEVNPESKNREAIQQFWDALNKAWIKAGRRPWIRELGRVLYYVGSSPNEVWPKPANLIPTIAFNGAIYLFAPELARQTEPPGPNRPRYNHFVAGDFKRFSLGEIVIGSMTSRDQPMPVEVLAGSLACKDRCQYYPYCGGGEPGNRYQENGGFGSGTQETDQCRFGVQKPYVTVTGTRLRSPEDSQQQ